MAGPCLNYRKVIWMEESWMEEPCVYYHRCKLMKGPCLNYISKLDVRTRCILSQR